MYKRWAVTQKGWNTLFLKYFHAVSYIALKIHVPLPRFSETFSMWCKGKFGTKWHRFHYCCNLWWVQSLYGINTLDYKFHNTHSLNKQSVNCVIAVYLHPSSILASSITYEQLMHYTVAMSHNHTVYKSWKTWVILSIAIQNRTQPNLNRGKRNCQDYVYDVLLYNWIRYWDKIDVKHRRNFIVDNKCSRNMIRVWGKKRTVKKFSNVHVLRWSH